MRRTVLKGLQLPKDLANADNAKLTQSTILPIRMNRVIGGFDEELLTVMGCVEQAETKKQTNAA